MRPSSPAFPGLLLGFVLFPDLTRVFPLVSGIILGLVLATSINLSGWSLWW